jgi:hypothetical protein
MLTLRREPFPFEAVRDLLGILRAMYAAARARDAGARELASIRRVGNELRTAIDLALEHAPQTLGHAAAWDRAENATRDLGKLIDSTTPLEPMLGAAARRIRRARVMLEDRDLSRRARIRRG